MYMKASALLLAAFGLSGCLAQTGSDRWVDSGLGRNHHLSEMVAGVWVDPNGCDHWIIDDGLEGYLSERLTPDGRPVCSGVAPPSTAVGPYQNGRFDPR